MHDQLGGERSQRRSVHHAVPRRAVHQDQVFAPGGAAQEGMTVGRHLVQAGPAVRTIDGHSGESRYAFHRDGLHFAKPSVVHVDAEGIAGARRGAQQQHAPVPNPHMEAVARPQRHRHVLRQRGGRRRASDLAAQRRDRHLDSGPASQLAGPRSGRVHHGATRDLLAGEPHGTDPSVSPPHELLHLLAEAHAHATPARGVEVPAQGGKRTEEPGRRAKRAADHIVQARRGVEPCDLRRLDHARFGKACLVLHALRGAQGRKLAGGARQPEIPAGTVSRVGADLLGEAAQLLAREERQAHVDRGAELGTEAARRACGAAISRRPGAVHHQHVAHAESAEVPGDAGADHAGAGDHHLGALPHPPMLAEAQRAAADAAGDFCPSASATALSCASPFSKSFPIILSMFMKTENAFPAKPLCPSIVHVTSVPPPLGAKVKVLELVEANGFRNSSLMRSNSPGRASTMVILPSPTLSWPSHAYEEPGAATGPAKVVFIVGSSFAQGDHFSHWWKSATWTYTVEAGAAIACDRDTRYEAGRVATNTANAARTTTTASSSFLSMRDPPGELLRVYGLPHPQGKRAPEYLRAAGGR